MQVVQCLYGEIPKNKQDIILECMTSVKRIYPQVQVFKFPSTTVPLYESSKWRWEFLQNNDDVLYVDWDVKLSKPLNLENNGKLSAIFYMDYPDDCLVYSPKKELFVVLENERLRRGILFTTFGWHRKVMRKTPCNEILTGGDTGIEHLRTSGMPELVKQYGSLKNILRL